MLKTVFALILATTLAAGVALVSSPSAATAPPIGPGGVLEMHRQLFAAMDRGDIEAVKSFVDDERKHGESQGSIFMLDAAGAPTAAWGSAAACDLLGRVVAEQSKSGGEWKTTITRTSADCPSGDVSFAVLEIERSHTVDGKTEVKKYRSTGLVRLNDGRWKLFHWHVSLANASETALTKK